MYENIYTKEQLKDFVTYHSKSPYFFSPDTMRFFRSRLAPTFIHSGRGLIFITSEQFVTYYPEYHIDPRKYTIRILTNDGDINEIGEFQQYDTLRQARKAAKEYAEFIHLLP